jgi:uncharacterized protein
VSPSLTSPPPATPLAAPAISLQAAACLTGLSKRTLWRRLGNGQLPRGVVDVHGRATVVVSALQPHTRQPFTEADWQRALAADAGDVAAQMDWAWQCLEQADWTAAHYWLEQAARQHHPDAMHWLATLAFEGRLGSPDTATGLLWLAKAAKAGHAIAQAQMAGLRPA